MINSGKFAVLFLLVCVFPVAGCKSANPKPTPTPLAALENMIRALEAQDLTGYLACFTGSRKEMAVPKAMFEFSAAAKEFRDDFVRAYGMTAWNEFNADAQMEASATLRLPEPSVLAAAVITETADTATATFPDEPGAFELLKVSGNWRIKATSFMAPGGKADKFAEVMHKCADRIRDYRKAIGRDGIAPEDIDYELGRDMAKLMMGLDVPGPHRFEIDKM